MVSHCYPNLKVITRLDLTRVEPCQVLHCSPSLTNKYSTRVEMALVYYLKVLITTFNIL